MRRDWERRANVPRVSPQLNFECSQQALGISDGKARYLCTANLAFENAGAGPFTVDQIIFRLYGGSPCFDLPQMRLAGDGRSPAERWLANAGKAKLPDATGGPSCPHGLNRRIEGAVRIGSPADADADTFWTMLEAVTSDREGFNGISHYERNEHGGASASWFVTVPWLQYAYFAVETELSWSAKTPEGQIKSEPRGTPNLKHSHWYSLVVDKQKFGADVGPGQLSLPPAKSIH